MLALVKTLKKTRSGHKQGIFYCVCGSFCRCHIDDVLRGVQVSCGCYKRNNSSRLHTRHGESGTKGLVPEYECWKQLKQRCENTNNKNYKHYGGRGIKVCQRWRSYPAFLEDMGRKPTPSHSLDRVNNNGNYTPSNCRWATKKEQAQNRRNYEKNKPAHLRRTDSI